MTRVSVRRRVLVAIAALWVASILFLARDGGTLSARTWSVLGEFFAAAFHPTLVSESGSGGSLLPSLATAVRTTVAFALGGMSMALLIGVGLGFLASSGWWRGDASGGSTAPGPLLLRLLHRTTRAFIAALRSVHELLWALLFLAALGLSSGAAVLALALPYGGTLAKVFAELLDEAPTSAPRALRAIGAPASVTVLAGIVPQIFDDLVAYSFYRFECALRSSAILGFFGLPTLGYFLVLSFENLYYREVWTYLYTLFALVAISELWSGTLRRRRAHI